MKTILLLVCLVAAPSLRAACSCDCCSASDVIRMGDDVMPELAVTSVERALLRREVDRLKCALDTVDRESRDRPHVDGWIVAKSALWSAHYDYRERLRRLDEIEQEARGRVLVWEIATHRYRWMKREGVQ